MDSFGRYIDILTILDSEQKPYRISSLALARTYIVDVKNKGKIYIPDFNSKNKLIDNIVLFFNN